MTIFPSKMAMMKISALCPHGIDAPARSRLNNRPDYKWDEPKLASVLGLPSILVLSNTLVLWQIMTPSSLLFKAKKCKQDNSQWKDFYRVTYKLGGHAFMTSTKKSRFDLPPPPSTWAEPPLPLVDDHTRSTWNTHRSLEMASTLTYRT